MKKGNSGVNMAIRLLLLREYLLANAVKEHPKRRGEMEKFLESKGLSSREKDDIPRFRGITGLFLSSTGI